jgi:RNA polymerase sigma factor (sigma-70 family)
MTPLLSSALLRAQSDERLAELAAAGHDRAFEAIVERYRRPLLRYLRRLLSETLAEDVVQATFINAWSSLRTGTEVRDLRPWLYRIAHNAAINALKKVGEVMEEVPESIGGFATEPGTELERRDEMRHALTTIAALPSRQRAALLAVAVDGRAHAEVAAELGLTDGAVRQLVHRARTTLRSTATALTPAPLLHTVVASAGDSTVARVAEVAAGAGGAGAATLSLKAGAAAVLATGALVTGGPEVARVVHPSHKPSESSAAASPTPLAPASAARHVEGASSPSGVIAPRPVTATRFTLRA